jgi:hypothetical protein
MNLQLLYRMGGLLHSHRYEADVNDILDLHHEESWLSHSVPLQASWALVSFHGMD